MGDAGAKALAKALSQNYSLTSFDLGYNQIGDAGAQALAQVLPQIHFLVSLNLRGNQIGDAGAQALVRVLPQVHSLTSLDLSDNKIGDVGAKALAEATSHDHILIKLEIGGNQIEEALEKEIYQLIDRNKKLTNDFLHAVQNNNIPLVQNLLNTGVSPMAKYGDNSDTALHLAVQAKLIDMATFLVTLPIPLTIRNRKGDTILCIAEKTGWFKEKELYESNIGQYIRLYCELRCKGFDSSKHIQLRPDAKDLQITINLSHSAIQKETARQLVQILISYSIIFHIDLSHNQMDDVIAEQFVPLLRDHPSLQIVDFSNNQITYEGAKALIKAVQNNQILRTLRLSNNHIHVGKRYFDELLEKVNPNGAIAIDVSHNYLGKECKSALIEHGIFRTAPNETYSIILRERKITYNDWVVYLLRNTRTDDQHAMIIIEGMYGYGQLFIQMSDFRPVSPEKVKGEVNTRFYDPERTLRNVQNYQYIPYPLDRITVKKLQRFIKMDEEKTLFYSKSGGGGSTKRAYNCLTWAISKLREIGLEVSEPRFIAIPSLYIRGDKMDAHEASPKDQSGRNCLIM